MDRQPPHTQEEDKFARLTALLMQQDRENFQEIRVEVERLKADLVAPEEIHRRVQPFIDANVNYLREHFPELFGPVLAETMKRQIRDSQDEMIEALYPIIGKLIRRFVAKEMELLAERVDQSVNNAFSLKAWVRRAKGWWSGESEKDRVVKDMIPTELVEVFIIEKESGLLMGNWALRQLADRDMVAGMLTAIRSFVETAFEAGQQALQMIEYDEYRILLQDFHTYYFAVVVQGPVSHSYRDTLTQNLLDFAEQHPIHSNGSVEQSDFDRNSKALENHFHGLTGQHQ